MKTKIHLYNNVNSPSTLRALEKKLLMYGNSNKMIIFSHIKIETVDEVYGRKNKTRQRTYLTECEVNGYNQNGEFVGIFDEGDVKRIIEYYDLFKMRRIWLDFKKQYDVMIGLEK